MKPENNYERELENQGVGKGKQEERERILKITYQLQSKAKVIDEDKLYFDIPDWEHFKWQINTEEETAK